MKSTTANEFRKKLKYYVDMSISNHDVLRIERRNGENFIVLGEKDWNAIEETIYLNQVPGLVNSIKDAAQEPLEEGTSFEELDW
ncbi:MAG: type II toxin-antitoxin system Phd/YefM family antitoxin [Pseudomonadota bacterium]